MSDVIPAVVPVQTPSQQGGLPDMTIPTPPNPATPSVPTPEPKKEKFIIGTREFSSADEAMAYANGLAEIQARVANEPTATPAAPPPQKKLGQVLFEDPDEALKQLKEQAKEEMRAEQRAIDQQKKIWEDFYSKHPDLKGSELLVDAVLGREQASGNFRTLSVDQAMPILAQKTREAVAKIRNTPQGGEPLHAGPATVAGASGAPVVRPPAAPAPVTDFVSELRSLRKRG